MTILQEIQNKIQSFFNPTYFQVLNESHLHHVPKGAETHFKIEIVTLMFDGKKTLERHRLVNSALKEEFEKIKASTLYTFTPDEWDIKKREDRSSSQCVNYIKKN